MDHNEVESIKDAFKYEAGTAGLSVDSIIDAAFEGNPLDWRFLARIIPNYMPPFPRHDTRPSVVVKFGKAFLRHSAGPKQGFLWDMFGDDFKTPGLAFIALMNAPAPPCLWMAKCFGPERQMWVG